MYLISFLISILFISYLSVSKRRIDIFTLSGFSLVYYYLPIFIGEISILGVVNAEPVNKGVYLCYIILAFLLSLFIYLNDFVFKVNTPYLQDREKKKESNLSPTFELSSILVLLLILALAISQVGFDFYSGRKTELRSEGGAILGLLEWSVLFFLSLSIAYNKKLLFVISVLGLLFSLSLGSRSIFAIGVISIALLKYGGVSVVAIKKYKQITLAIAAILFITVYKLAFTYIREGEFILAVSAMLNIDTTTLNALLFVDSNSVVYNLNTVFNSNIELNSLYILHRVISIIPFASGLLEHITGDEFRRFSDILNNDYHVSTHWGLASSLIGELYAMGGYMLIAISSVATYSLFLFLNRRIFNYSSIFYVSLLPIIVYIAFYSHRVDITFVIGMFKNLLFILGMLLAINSMLGLILPKGKQNSNV